MFTAVGNARPVVKFFVDALNRHVFTPVIAWPETGQGTKRRRAREAQKRAANKSIPAAEISTRQRRRADDRKQAKLRRVTPAEEGRRAMKVARKARREREAA